MNAAGYFLNVHSGKADGGHRIVLLDLNPVESGVGNNKPLFRTSKTSILLLVRRNYCGCEIIHTGRESAGIFGPLSDGDLASLRLI